MRQRGDGSMLYSVGVISGSGQFVVNTTFTGTTGTTSISFSQGNAMFSENNNIFNNDFSPLGPNSIMSILDSDNGNYLTLRISSSLDVNGINVSVQATAGLLSKDIVRLSGSKSMPNSIYVVASKRLDKKTLNYLKNWN